ncbi:MAG TPA: bacillithiol biosynthesis cysteine-adding enzyme BshC, partial [Rubricoccaceae bacterium]
TVYKALSAVRTAVHVEALTGRPAVPVFWLADEDHDFAEVREAVFTDGPHIRRVAYDDGRPLGAAPRPPVGRIVLDAARLAETFAQLERALPAGPHRAQALALARDAYRAGRTMRDAFAILLRSLAPGLVLMSADDVRLKRLAAPVLEREAEDWRETAQTLDAQSARLVAAGFHAQVAPSPLGLFWTDDDGIRRPVDPLDAGSEAGARSGGVTLRGTGIRWTDAEWTQRVAGHPQHVSPNVVLRPLVQDTLLPTAAYVAGPGEAAYYAQLTPVYAAFGVPMPAIVPRLSLTLVEPGVRKVLDRDGLGVPDLRGRLDGLWARLALADSDIPGAFADARRDAEALADRLDRATASVDGSLAGAAGAARQALRDAVARLETKTVRVEKRRHADVRARLDRAQAALWPGGALQERALSPLQIVALHGLSALPDAVSAVPLDSSMHHVVDL